MSQAYACGYTARKLSLKPEEENGGTSVDLQAAINRFVAEQNAAPKPFIWTADPNRIIAAVRRGHQALDSIH